MMLSQSSPGKEKRWASASFVLFVFVLILGGLTVGDYGKTWDERFRFQGGDAKLSYYEELFSGEKPSVMSDSYPGLFDLPLALAHKMFPDWGTRSQKGHLWSLCFGLLGLLAAWRTAARLGGERAGFWALALLVATPRYYGHMFFNPKDIPLAGTYMLGVWALVALFQKMPKVPWRAVVLVGFAAGLTMSTRIAGFLLLVYFGLFAGLYLLFEYGYRALKNREDFEAKALGQDLLAWALRGAVSGLVALVPLLIFWPALHDNPFSQAGATAGNVQSFGWDGWVLMQGNFHQAAELPFYYMPYWFLRTLPELHLLLIAGCLCAAFVYLKRLRGKDWKVAPSWWMPISVLAFSSAFPLLYIYFTQPVLYDGMRHFLFALPPLVTAAALGMEFWLRRLAPRLCFLAQAVGLGVLATVVIDMVSLHPYQYVYFNSVSGGLNEAYMRDETDYWGASHKEAAEWLNSYVAESNPDEGRVFRVHQRYSRWMLQEHLDKERFIMSKEREGADFFVSITRFNLHTSYPDAEIIHVVQRQGVPLCFVFALPAVDSEADED
ncbi:MAG: ArnT family glycosyltransferase [Opitutales bacterium]